MAEPVEHPIVLACERDRCEYVVYGDKAKQTHRDRANELYADHLRQHDDPAGWKADHPETEGDE